MHRFFYILVFALCAGVGGTASAQRMPERSAVRSGNRQFNKGNYEESIERYGKALRFAPSSFEATYDLGNALYKAERYDQAEQTMRQAAADTLRIEKERAEAFYNLGNAQFRQKKYKEALESYKQSLRLDPSDVETKYNYAYTKKLLDDQQNGGGGQNQQQDQNQQNQQNQQDQQNGGNSDQQENKDDGRQNPDDSSDEQQNDPQQQPSEPQQGDDDEQQGEPQPIPAGISEQEQEQMLDAIQAQEDRTQEKLKEKRGVVVRGGKNW